MELRLESNDLYKQKRKDYEISWIKESRKGGLKMKTENIMFYEEINN